MKQNFYKRPLALCVLALVITLMCACEKADGHFAELAEYYKESLTLPQQQTDSIDRFELKVAGYVARRPEARDDQYYQLIIANIRQARLSIELLNSPEWVKDTLRFDF